MKAYLTWLILIGATWVAFVQAPATAAALPEPLAVAFLFATMGRALWTVGRFAARGVGVAHWS